VLNIFETSLLSGDLSLSGYMCRRSICRRCCRVL